MYNWKEVVYREIPNKEITEQGIIELEDVSPKRIHFGGSHSHALQRRVGNCIATIKLPFKDTIVPVFNKLGVALFPSKFDTSQYYRNIYREDEFDLVAGLIEKYKDIVFLRDLLDSPSSHHQMAFHS